MMDDEDDMMAIFGTTGSNTTSSDNAPSSEPTPASASNVSNNDQDEEEDDDESDEDDVAIVLDSTAKPTVTPVKNTTNKYVRPGESGGPSSTSAANSAMKAKLQQQLASLQAITGQAAQTTAPPTVTPSTPTATTAPTPAPPPPMTAPKPNPAASIAQYEQDLETLSEKPWRRPGADITDYFNYGFDEDTWRAYCMKQVQIRVQNKALQSKSGDGSSSPAASSSPIRPLSPIHLNIPPPQAHVPPVKIPINIPSAQQHPSASPTTPITPQQNTRTTQPQQQQQQPTHKPDTSHPPPSHAQTAPARASRFGPPVSQQPQPPPPPPQQQQSQAPSSQGQGRPGPGPGPGQQQQQRQPPPSRPPPQQQQQQQQQRAPPTFTAQPLQAYDDDEYGEEDFSVPTRVDERDPKRARR